MADHLQSLRKVPLFSHCTDRDLKRIARVADPFHVEPGRVLATEGDLGHEAFIIVDAEVEVSIGGKSVAVLGRAQPVGEMALVERKPRNATVTVTTAGTVLAIGQREFAALLEESSFARTIMIALADRVRLMDQTYVG
jgi:CRP/FNR family cyclic AMP-dependent transcriptional regulator